MPFGDFLANEAAGLFGLDEVSSKMLGFAGGLFDYAMDANVARKDQASRNKALALQEAAVRQQIAMAQQNAAIEQQLREELLARVGQFGEGLNQLYADLGPSYTPTAEGIAADYGQLRDLYRTDVDRSMERTISANAADDILYGRDTMPTLQRYNNSIYTGQYSDSLRRADQQAYEDAVRRASATAGAINDGRTYRINEYGTVVRQPIDMATGLMPNSAAQLAYGGQSANSYTGQWDALAGASAGAAQDSLGKLFKNYGGIGEALGNPPRDPVQVTNPAVPLPRPPSINYPTPRG